MNSEYQDRITDMTKAAQHQSLACQGKNGQRWMRFEPDYAVHDQKAISDAFPREKTANVYKKAIDAKDKKDGTRDAMSARLQTEIIGSLQQGTVLRHRTRLQAMAATISRSEALAGYKLTDLFIQPIQALEAT